MSETIKDLVKRDFSSLNELENATSQQITFDNLNGDDPLRLCLLGLSKFTAEKDIIKGVSAFCPEKPFSLDTVSKNKKNNHAFIKFSSEEEKSRFETLSQNSDSLIIKNHKIKVKPVPLGKFGIKNEKTPDQIKKQSEHKKVQPNLGSLDIQLTLQDIQNKICPYYGVPYETQVLEKKKKIEEALENLKKNALKAIKPNETDLALSWVQNKNSALLCPLKEFIPCPEEYIHYYRNKTEFTIGKSNIKKDKIRIGFNIGDFKKGYMFVERSDNVEELPIISKIAFRTAEIFEDFINTTRLTAYDRALNQGFYRYLIVRHSETTKEYIINLVCNKNSAPPQIYEDDILSKYKECLIKKLTEDDILRNYTLVCFKIQNYTENSDAVPANSEGSEILYGDRDYFMDIIMGKNFQVTFSSFLQIHSAMCQKLYAAVDSYLSIDENTILLDICSGIGTIGLCIGTKAKKIIAIECVSDACKSAVKNAEINNVGVEKYEVLCSKVEDVIVDVVKKYSSKSRIVAIVDPPRAGLHGQVTKSLRTCKGLDEMIYIACSIESIGNNVQELCLPEGKKRKGPPFSPIYCVGFDLFPFTTHFESVLYLKRLYEI